MSAHSPETDTGPPDRLHRSSAPEARNRICTVEPGTTHVLQNGEGGELCLFTDAVMTGYYRNSEATNAVLKPHND